MPVTYHKHMPRYDQNRQRVSREAEGRALHT
jgi:hypothetical protein